MKIVVGLGNPGAQYANTPHNVGFEAVDRIAAGMGAAWEFKKAYNALWCRGVFAGSPVVCVKPQTFMNLSGDAVAPIVKYSNAGPGDLIVIHDDIDLAVGRIRVRKSGSCGGHNGVRSIIERLGSAGFVRVKIGVGKDKDNVVGYVLGKLSPELRNVLDKSIDAAAEAAASVVRSGPDFAMNAFNAFRVPET